MSQKQLAVCSSTLVAFQKEFCWMCRPHLHLLILAQVWELEDGSMRRLTRLGSRRHPTSSQRLFSASSILQNVVAGVTNAHLHIPRKNLLQSQASSRRSSVPSG